MLSIMEAESKIENIKSVTLPVTGMSCAACAVSVESMLKSTAGVADAGVNYANQSAYVKFDKGATNLEALDKVLQSIGYGFIISDDQDEVIAEQEKQQLEHYASLKTRTIWTGILSLPVVIIGMFFMSDSSVSYGNYIMMILTAPVLFIFGRDFFVNAWKQAKHGKSNMDTLVALSTGIAFLFSTFNTLYPEFWHQRGLHPHVYFEAAAVIIFFILLGKLLEERAKSNTSGALKKLIGLQPKTVYVRRDGQEIEIPVREILLHDEVVIRSGEKIPVDGVVLSGNSFIDESLMTGEPIPAEKTKGAQVFAGTINQQGSFTFSAEKIGKDTVLAQIIKTVQNAQGSKAPVQRLVDKIAGIFVPVVISIAVMTFCLWMFFGGENAVTQALLAAVSVLVIACPCALGLATPTAIMVGVGKGAENNILIRDAESLEKAQEVDVIILDKTGTLTEGHPKVTDWMWRADIENQEIHAAAIALLESRSEHPLALAIVDFVKTKSNGQVEEFHAVTGKGVTGRVDGDYYQIGTLSYLKNENVVMDLLLADYASDWQMAAKTVIGVGLNKQLVAVIAITDQLKGSSAEAVKRLREEGIEVFMLTGDNVHTAASIASQVGIKDFQAEVKPDDKMQFVKKQQAAGKVVAMVGDGINDSQALAQADVSIAMGKGSDIAMDVAKMTLITSDLLVLPKALLLSKKTVATIKQNLFWAFFYNLIGIPIAAGILYPFNGFLLNPMIAGGAMALSSVSVVANSLRLSRVKL